MEELIRNLRFTGRQMLRAPGFTVAILACLAIGIGANSATYSFAKTVLNPPSLVKDPDRLVRLFTEHSNGLKYGSFSYPDYKDLRDQGKVFSELAVDTPTPLHISNEGQNERYWGSLVSGNYFTTLGVEVIKGRSFRPEEDSVEGAHPVVVVSHGFWQRRFGGDPGAIGRTLDINGHPFTIIGITPEGFSGGNAGFHLEFWVPMMMYKVITPGREIEERDNHWLGYVIGRLKPGVTVAQAQAEVKTSMSRFAQAYPATNKGKTAVVLPESKSSLHPMVRGAFVSFVSLMFAIVGVVLLLACSNVAGLLMARSAARRREIGIRLSLGVGRRRLLGQLLTESLVLSLVAGVLGIGLSLFLTRAIQAFRPPFDMPIVFEPKLDPGVLGFTLLITLVTGVLFGLAPALHATRTDLVTSLKDGSPGAGSGGFWLRKALVIGQVCLSMILLIGAGLALQSLKNAHGADFGFQSENRLLASVDLELQGYDEPKGRQFLRNVREHLAALPSVENVSYADFPPLSLNRQQASIQPEGFEAAEGSDVPIIGYSRVGPEFFKTMGISLLQGRGFSATDQTDTPLVAVVNQTLADQYWPHQQAIGKHLTFGSGKRLEVVGVARDGKYFSVGEEPTPYVYAPLEQGYRGAVTFVVQTQSNPALLLEPVRREITRFDPKLPVFNLKTLSEHLSFALLPSRLAAVIISVFAGLALFLSALGLFAIISYWAAQRASDFAIRQAIGATSGQIARLVFRQGFTLAIGGLVLGLAIGALLSRLIAGMLYGVSVGNPAPYLAAAAALLLVVALACLLPAQKMIKRNVVLALRGD
ncbi:MAG TPA: ABC transporter permease [Thermoanaerobaculia bacterium]|jgi:predicted permease|nr:ABC transporter permease [Thermoanaerobaculia bacterium]